jgi:hypothetical protein
MGDPVNITPLNAGTVTSWGFENVMTSNMIDVDSFFQDGKIHLAQNVLG